MPKERKDLDGSEDFSLVEIKDNRPTCKIHGAMNKVSKDIWRCITQYGRTDEGKFIDRICNACCLEANMNICGKCNTKQNMEKRTIIPDKKSNNQKECITYWCPNCKDQISPGACKA